MVNATAWNIGSEGFNYLTNQTNISIVKSAITGWQQSGEGIAAFFIFSFIIFLAGSIIYMRTQKIFPTLFGMLMTTFAVSYYKLLDYQITLGGMKWYSGQVLIYIYILIVVSFGIGFYFILTKRGD